MKLLALGDIVDNNGCEFVRKNLPEIKRKNSIDICIANGENSASGNGILPFSADHLFTSGVDIITTGNHVFRRAEIFTYLDEHNDILRPYNMHPSNPGKGIGIIDMGKYRIGVINLIGSAFFSSNFGNPFDYLDKAVEETKDCKIKIVDFHAEATGEKRALGFYADSRISVLFGTHTHVQTADAQILPKGTGYITDLGMCGAKDSVLGVEPEIVATALKTGMPARFKTVSQGKMMINGCIFEIDENSGLTKSVNPLYIEE
jgi:metallophosphoesterase (TIGR00282 family)